MNSDNKASGSESASSATFAKSAIAELSLLQHLHGRSGGGGRSTHFLVPLAIAALEDMGASSTQNGFCILTTPSSLPLSTMMLAAHSETPTSSSGKKRNLSVNPVFLISLCKDVLSAVEHCCKVGIYLKWISIDSLYVNNGRFLLTTCDLLSLSVQISKFYFRFRFCRGDLDVLWL